MNDILLSKIQSVHIASAINILKRNNLSYSDLMDSKIYMLGAFKGNELIGICGLEIYGNTGLFRSLVVAENYRTTGIGKRLHQSILAQSLVHGLNQLYLLTTSAETYFEKLGWEKVKRDEVQEDVKKSAEFSELCPDTAICMMFRLPQSKSEQAVQIFRTGFNCAQSTFLPFTRDYNIDENHALKLATGFGAGMVYRGETCGAVTGAMMAIGLKYGRSIASDEQSREKTYQLINAFYDEFKKQNGSIICKELLGIDISTQEGKMKAGKEGLFQNLCPMLVKSAVEITENLLK